MSYNDSPAATDPAPAEASALVMSARQRRPDNAPDMELRALLNRRRVALGLSIADIARELALSAGAVGHWMVGRRVPLLSEVSALAHMLGIERAELATLVRAARMYRRRREPTAAPRPAQRGPVAQEPLGSTDAMLKALGDLFSDAVLILDMTGRVTYVNPIAEAFFRTNLRNMDHREAGRRFGSVTDESGLVVSPEDSPFAHGLGSESRTNPLRGLPPTE